MNIDKDKLTFKSSWAGTWDSAEDHCCCLPLVCLHSACTALQRSTCGPARTDDSLRK